MKHRISRRAFLNGCTLLAAAAAISSLTSCGEKEAKDSGLAQIVVGSDSYPPYIYLNNDGVPTGIDVEIATEAFRRMVKWSLRLSPSALHLALPVLISRLFLPCQAVQERLF